MPQAPKPRKPYAHFYIKVVIALGILTAIALLSSCALFNKDPEPAPGIVETTRAIPVRPEAPADLTRRYQPHAIPEWVAPSDPSASSCLTQEGEDQQRKNMQDEQRLRKRSRVYASGVI